jgi:hypothetical protein
VARAKYARRDTLGAHESLLTAAAAVPPLVNKFPPNNVWLYDTVVSLATSQIAMEDKDGARKTLASAVAAAREYSNNSPDYAAPAVSALTRLADVQITAEDINSARQTAKVALDRVLTWDDRLGDAAVRRRMNRPNKWKALVAIAQIQASTGDVAEARDTIRAAADAVRQIGSGQVELENVLALTAVARCQAEIGDKVGSLRLLDDALNMARKMHERPSQQWSFSVAMPALAAARVTAADDAGAESLLQEMDPTAFRPIEQGDQDQRTAAIEGLIRHGRYTAVLDLAERSKSVFIYAVVAGELFRMEGLDVKSSDRKWWDEWALRTGTE